jgi:hypothetical protein
VDVIAQALHAIQFESIGDPVRRCVAGSGNDVAFMARKQYFATEEPYGLDSYNSLVVDWSGVKGTVSL